MSIPVWVLLGFAGWTLLTLLSTIGLYRWSRILTGKAEIKEFPADVPHGSDWYRRAMRAHANCVENLPVYTAIVVAILASGVQSPVLDRLASVLLIGRVLQTTIHIGFEPTNTTVSLRFACFFVQLICMFWMGIFIAIYG
uniref:MAPEG family protein n=1 Tax=Cyanothece sp. (strain PCC 7425 / ATCC 29141) TaxID=395961 RepID=B8HL51_CYAP4